MIPAIISHGLRSCLRFAFLLVGLALAVPLGAQSLANSADLGSGTSPGSSGFDQVSGIYALASSVSSTPPSTQDFGRFTYVPVWGDGEIVARVNVSSPEGGSDSFGVMLRESLDPGARMAFVRCQPLNGARASFTSRTTAGVARSVSLAGPDHRWMRLSRTGTTLTGFASPDGVAWTPLGSVTMPLGDIVYVGVAALPDAAGHVAAAEFASVDVSSFCPAAGLAAWFNAERGVTMDASNLISGWLDQSASGALAAQADVARQPLLVPNAVNGWPAVRFDGNSTYLQTAPFDLLQGSPDYTVFLVGKAGPTQVSYADVFDWDHGWGYGFVLQNDGSATNRFQLNGAVPFTLNASGYGLLTVIKAGAAEWIYGEARLLDYGVAGTFAQYPPRALALGSKANLAYPRFFNGEVAELLIYSRRLSEPERQAVAARLSAKYGLVAAPATAPAAPAARAVSPSQVSVTWTLGAVASPEGWLVERRTLPSGSFAPVAYAPGAEQRAWLDEGVAPGTGYAYRVQAWNSGGSSPWSAESPATPPPSGPALSLGGLTLWLRADAGLETDSNGKVIRWSDASGRGYNARQATAASRPTPTTSGANGQPSVWFDGSASFLDLPPGFSELADGFTALVVAKPVGAPSWARFFDFGNGSAADNLLLARVGSSSNLVYYSMVGGSVAAGVEAPGLIQPNLVQLFGLTHGSGVASLYWNERLKTTSAAGAISPALRASNFLGRSNWPDSLYAGEIAEVMIFDRVLPAAERMAIEDYLNARYGFNPPPTAPTAVVASPLSAGQIALSWFQEADDLTGFTVERSVGGGPFALVATLGASQRGWIDAGLAPGESCAYRVTAINRTGSSPASPASATTPTSGAALPTQDIRTWLRADAGVVAANGAVSRWQDLARRNDAVQLDGSRQPQLVENALNGRPVLRFEGKWVNLAPNFMDGTSAAEVFVVLKHNVAVGEWPFLWLMGREDDSFYDTDVTYYPASDGAIYDRFGSTARKSTGRPAQDLNVTHLYNVSSQDGEWTSRLNGALHYTTSANAYYFPPNALLGASNHYYGGQWAGDVAELIIYDRKLSDAEREAVGYYLNQKWNFIAPIAPTPTAGSAVALAGSQVSLNWSSAATDWTVVYDIERKSAGGNWVLVATAPNALSWVDQAAQPGTAYRYRVRARNYQGISDWSQEFGVATPSSSGTAMPFGGMRLWLKADAGTLAGSENIWLDQSGQNRHATQLNGGRQPQLVENALNGRPVVRFNGTGSWMDLAHDFMSGATAAEVFVVLKRNPAVSTGVYLWMTGKEADEYYDGYVSVYPWWQDGMIYERFGSMTRKTTGRPAQDLAVPHLYNVVSQNGEWISRLNGTTHYATSDNAFFYPADSTLGAVPHYHGGCFAGDIAELIIYDRKLSEQEREAVGFYLNQKWNFIASAAPTPTAGSAMALAGSQVSLNWSSAAADWTVVYDIERKSAGGDWVAVATVANTLSWIDQTAQPGAAYTYRVRARNYQGVSGWSQEFGVTTPALAGVAMPMGNMRLWLKADAGTVAGSENIWLDQSGQGNHAVQPDGGRQPQRVENALNGHPVLRFDDKWMNLAPNFMNGTAAAEIFVVLKHVGTVGAPGGGPFLWLMGREDDSYYDTDVTYYPASDGAIYDRFGSTARKSTGRPAQDLNVTHLYNVSSQDGEWTSRLNGALHYTTSANAYYFPPNALLGASNHYYGGAFGGEIAEVIIYDRKLSDQERERVQYYLAAKYLIPDYDSDGDGLTNAQEIALGTNPFSSVNVEAPQLALVNPPAGGAPDGGTLVLGITGGQGTLRYTLDGSDPTAASPILSAGTLAFTQSTTVKVRSFDKGLFSEVTTFQVSFRPKPPVASLMPDGLPSQGGVFTGPISIYLRPVTPNSRVRHAIEQMDVGEDDAAETPFALTESHWFRAVAFRDGFDPSEPLSLAYQIYGPASRPSCSPAGGAPPSGPISIAAAPDEQVHYTLDGSVPTVGSPVYSVSLTVPPGSLLRARAFGAGRNASATQSAVYPATGPVNPVLLSPPPGEYPVYQKLTVAPIVPQAGTVRLALDGAPLTAGSEAWPVEIERDLPAAATVNVAAFSAAGQASATTGGSYFYTGAIGGGGTHAVLLRTDRTLWGVGGNDSSQLGATGADRSTPTQLAALPDIVGAAAGQRHSLAVNAAGQLFAWGANDQGQAAGGNGQAVVGAPAEFIPPQFGVRFAGVAAGDDFSLAIDREGRAWTWGSNSAGQLGNGSAASAQPEPRIIPGLIEVVALSAGSDHALALRQNGDVWAWGSNQRGQIGDASTQTRRLPVPVPGLGYGFKAVAAGAEHSVALRRDGTVWTWGGNSAGQLGSGNTTERGVPAQVPLPAAVTITKIAAGRYHTLALDSEGKVWAWGRALGVGKASDLPVPTSILGLTGVTALGAGLDTSYAGLGTGGIRVWGANGRGQLGDATLTDRAAASNASASSFSLIGGSAGDSDGDGLPDWWEQLHFGGLSKGPNDLSPAGVPLWRCYLEGRNPNASAPGADPGGPPPALTVLTPGFE